MKRFTTGQVAKRFGLTVRTLRYYDGIGLLSPGIRELNGRRYYTEDDLLKLEKVMLLKSLALPLDEIGALQEQLSLQDILIAHHNRLREQRAGLQRSMDNTASLINMLDLEGAVPWERLSELAGRPPETPAKWRDYFRDRDKEFLEQSLPALEQDDEHTQQYVSLLRRMEWCVSHSIAPASKEGGEIAAELLALSDRTFGGDEHLAARFWEVRKLPADETGLYPVPDEVLSFVEKAVEAYLAQAQ